jgi:hypothetical protein
MTTASDIISRGLRQLRILDIDSSADATQLANGLIVLNGLVDEWNSESQTLYQEQEETFTLTGATSYTIGSAGTFNTVRPEKIISAFYRLGGIDYPPLTLTPKINWDVIQQKTTPGYPEALWYDEAYPLGVIHLWPNPTSGTLVLSTLKQLTEFAATSTTVSLPPGYRDALTYNFAVRYSPEGGILTDDIRRLAVKTLAAVKRNNRKLTRAFLECPGLSSLGRSTILSG